MQIQLQGSLCKLPREFRVLVTFFVLALNIGFFTGFSFVRVTTALDVDGIERNYLGNEEDEDAAIMQFKKSEKEILTLIHNHVLSLSIIFFMLGVLVMLSNTPQLLRSILMFEPFVSLILTFGGIYLMWLGLTWFKYIIMISGIAMVISVLLMSVLVLKDCLLPGIKK